MEFDGFGRPLRRTFSPPGGELGVLSTFGYEGFSETDPLDPQGRRIIVKEFRDPVAPANAASTAGPTATVFLDELGRKQRTELSLGTDYANDSLVLNARVYDLAGRVAFQADPYPLSRGSANPYGTSYHFKNTGDLNCIIRGFGQQPLNNQTDIAIERFPTCFQRYIDNHVVTLDIQDAASLQTDSPEAGTVHRVVSTAIGRAIERSTVKAGTRLDHATFSYDRLGQLRSIARYLDPAGATKPVEWWLRRDSAGQLLQLDEPESATLRFNYSDWGELVETQWMDGPTDRRLLRTYDALGRLTQTEERNNGLAEPETLNKYVYDTGVSISPLVTPTYVLGRLAGARSPRGEVAFSYEAYGRLNARVFRGDQTGPFVEKAERHADGSLATLEFNLPDQNFAREVVKYGYDSAGRLKSTKFIDALEERDLYQAASIDPWGRVRKAFLDSTITYQADYADIGRRLLKTTIIETPHGSRKVIFLDVNPVGRELSRREIKDAGATGSKTDFLFDALGHLRSVQRTDGITALSNFRYDPLGNIVSLRDIFPPNPGVRLSYSTSDRDRLCRIDYGPGPGGPCNVLHDTRGNIVSEPTRTGTREFSYYSSGAIRTISSQGVHAHFAYDAFGQVQELDVQGSAVENRRDRRYGRLIEQRDILEANTNVSRIIRHIPGPGGIFATRRGPTPNWVFQFGELRGNRYFVNQTGEFIQEVDYEPFGEASSTGAPAGTRDYSNYQWNGGDAIAAFGLSHLGARLYDPVIGRFLNRDPLLVPRTAATTNPYAFAINDPVNAADPSGLDVSYDLFISKSFDTDAGQNSLGLVPLFPGWPTSRGNPSAPATQQQAPNLQMIILPAAGVINPRTGAISPVPLNIVPGVSPDEPFNPLYWVARTNPFNLEPPGPSPFPIRTAYDDQKEMEELARSIWAEALIESTELLAVTVGQPFAVKLVSKLASRLGFGARAVGRGAGRAAVMADAAEGTTARGLSRLGGVLTSETNAVGGEVVTSTGIINQNDIAPFVNSGLYRGNVNIISGVHGEITGATVADFRLFDADVARFGNIPGVTIHNLPAMTPGQVTNLLNGPGTTIGAFCNSGACLAPFR
ncbi:RHS repeat-associated protein [Bradyrhizobium sp. GM0.4]